MAILYISNRGLLYALVGLWTILYNRIVLWGLIWGFIACTMLLMALYSDLLYFLKWGVIAYYPPFYKLYDINI